MERLEKCVSGSTIDKKTHILSLMLKTLSDENHKLMCKYTKQLKGKPIGGLSSTLDNALSSWETT